MKRYAIASFVGGAIATAIIQFPVNKGLESAWNFPVSNRGFDVPAPDHGFDLAAPIYDYTYTPSYNSTYTPRYDSTFSPRRK
jgi:hypothetical protein